MKINIKNLNRVIQKATLNYALDYCQIVFENNRMVSSLITYPKDVISILDTPNNVIIFDQEDHETITLNFISHEIKKDLRRLTKFSRQPIMDFEMDENGSIVFHPRHEYDNNTFEQTHTFPMLGDEFITPLLLLRAPRMLDYQAQIKIQGNLMHLFDQVQTYAEDYGKFYVSTTEGILSFDVKAGLAPYQKQIKIPVAMNLGIDDSLCCYSLINFSNLLKVLRSDNNDNDYIMGFVCIPGLDTNFIHVFTEDKSEQYYLLNQALE